MIPFPQANVPKLIPLFEAMIAESNLQGRSSQEHCLRRLYEGYGTRNMDVYVDDPEDPKRVIIFGKFPGIVTNEQLGVVLFLYAVPELRGDPATGAMLEEQIKQYMGFFNVDAVLASDWVYKGCQMGTGAFLRKIGFERQEVTYALLNSKKVATPQ